LKFLNRLVSEVSEVSENPFSSENIPDQQNDHPCQLLLYPLFFSPFLTWKEGGRAQVVVEGGLRGILVEVGKSPTSLTSLTQNGNFKESATPAPAEEPPD
jgi:hypothetical protein